MTKSGKRVMTRMVTALRMAAGMAGLTLALAACTSAKVEEQPSIYSATMAKPIPADVYPVIEGKLPAATTQMSNEAAASQSARLTALGALVESPGGALWIRRGGERFELAARVHTSPAQATLAADDPMCAFLEARQWVIDLRELAQEPERYAGLAVPPAVADLPRARLVVPLPSTSARTSSASASPGGAVVSEGAR